MSDIVVDVRPSFLPEKQIIIPELLTDTSMRADILSRFSSVRPKNIKKQQHALTNWQMFLLPLSAWLLHSSGFDKRFADTPGTVPDFSK